MKPSAQETQDVLGREVHRGVIEQPRIETSQRLAAGEDQVGGKFRLVVDPVVTEEPSKNNLDKFIKEM